MVREASMSDYVQLVLTLLGPSSRGGSIPRCTISVLMGSLVPPAPDSCRFSINCFLPSFEIIICSFSSARDNSHKHKFSCAIFLLPWNNQCSLLLK